MEFEFGDVIRHPGGSPVWEKGLWMVLGWHGDALLLVLLNGHEFRQKEWIERDGYPHEKYVGYLYGAVFEKAVIPSSS